MGKFIGILLFLLFFLWSATMLDKSQRYVSRSIEKDKNTLANEYARNKWDDKTYQRLMKVKESDSTQIFIWLLITFILSLLYLGNLFGIH